MADQAERVILEAEDQVSPVVDKAAVRPKSIIVDLIAKSTGKKNKTRLPVHRRLPLAPSTASRIGRLTVNQRVVPKRRTKSLSRPTRVFGTKRHTPAVPAASRLSQETRFMGVFHGFHGAC
jgi:hypothetical protein